MAFDHVQRNVRPSVLGFPNDFSGESPEYCDDDHHYVVISTWRSRSDGEVWAHSEARGQAQTQVAPLLEETDRVTIFDPV